MPLIKTIRLRFACEVSKKATHEGFPRQAENTCILHTNHGEKHPS